MAANQVERKIRVAIIGAGFSGLSQAVRLQERLGSKVEIQIFDKGSEIGGVWRDSTWPGTAVDIPIHLYALDSDPNPNWSTKFAERAEVIEYLNGIIGRHSLHPCLIFSSEFVSSSWSSETQTHTITFNRSGSVGESFTVEAEVLISAAGVLNTPVIPKLAGIDSFKGHQFHSSKWDVSIDLKGKSVAVIGNGTSGIQIVPNIAGIEGIKISQFIRSAGYLTPKVAHDYTSIHKFLFRWIPGFQRLYRWKLFWKFDYAGLSKGTGSWASALRERQTKSAVAYIYSKAPAEYHSILTPSHPLHRKRIGYNAFWLESLNLANVSLLATPIVSVSETGLVTSDGQMHQVDVIVWATGFAVAETGLGLNKGVRGEQGELRETWKNAGGASAFLGVAVPKYPNYFVVIGANAVAMSSGSTFSNQTTFIARLVEGLLAYNLTSIAPKSSATSLYNETMQARLEKTVFATGKKVSTQSGVSATEFSLRTRKIKWEDWEVRGMDGEITELASQRNWSPVSWVSDQVASWVERYLIHITSSA